MMHSTFQIRAAQNKLMGVKRARYRGAVLVYVTLIFTVFIAFTSMAVDVAHVRVVKSQLRAAADAAARYGAVGMSVDIATAKSYAVRAGGNNAADGTSVVIDSTNDIQFGSWDANNRVFTPLTGSAQTAATAIQVTARRTAANKNAVKLSFASLLGFKSCDCTSQATAVTSTYGFAIVGLSSLTTATSGASGNRNINIDSYNAATQAYTTFPMNSNGNCSSNGNVTLTTKGAIYGSCQPGSGKTISNPNTVHGSTAPLNYSLAYPAPNPGSAVTVNNNSSLPAAYFNSSTRNFSTPNNTSLTLPGGTYYVNNVSWQNTTFVFTGPVVFYVTGSFFTHNNYITTYQNLPKNLKFEITTATTVTYDFDQACYAVLYAPLAAVTTLGLADDYGSVVGNTLNLTTGWHVDESLSGAGVEGKIWIVQ